MEKKPEFVIQSYTEEELKKIEYTFENTRLYMPNPGGTFIRLRDLHIFKLSTTLGLRPAEALLMSWWDIDWENKIITMNPYHNKERDTKPIVLNEKAEQILKNWKEIMSKFIHCDIVFPSLTTFQAIGTSAWGKRLGKILDEAKIRKILWYTDQGQPIYDKKPYSCRKTFGKNIYMKSGDPYFTAKALRHTGTNHLHNYVQLTNDELRNRINNFM